MLQADTLDSFKRKREMDKNKDTSNTSSRFAEEAKEPSVGLLLELIDFLKDNKKWWLTPIILVLFLFGLLILIGGSAAAPFIYTIF
jgi:hypothetical protein